MRPFPKARAIGDGTILMRALVVYCHPDPTSFTAAVLKIVQAKLREAKAESRLEDLYKNQFNPVLTGSELTAYSDPDANKPPVREHVENIEWCDTLIFVYPTWWYGLPALLKGWLDRTMLPGSAFHLPTQNNRKIKPGLTHVTAVGVFTTCGATWLVTQLVGAPGKRTLLRGLRLVCARRARTTFAAHYAMDSSTAESRKRHLTRVARAMDRLLKASAASN